MSILIRGIVLAALVIGVCVLAHTGSTDTGVVYPNTSPLATHR